MSGRFVVICNPAAGGGRALKRLAVVEDELRRRGVESRTVRTGGLEDARAAAQGAAESGESVIAIGGDGLLRPIVGALRGSDSRLAIVPGGRGNDLARVLGIPTDPLAAVSIALAGSTRRIDVPTVDGRPYVGIASFGFDSDANRIANEARLIGGSAVYLYAALRALIGWRAAHFVVTVDGARRELTGYSVAVANSKAYGGGMFVAPQAELDDGLLDVVMIADVPKLRYASKLPRVFKGTHLSDPAVHVMRGSVIELEADRPFELYADGDPIGGLPARVEVEPQALQVIVPA